MYGDLQGIAGKALQEIDGLDAQLLLEDFERNEQPTIGTQSLAPNEIDGTEL
jgi:hypothetical protein